LIWGRPLPARRRLASLLDQILGHRLVRGQRRRIDRRVGRYREGSEPRNHHFCGGVHVNRLAVNAAGTIGAMLVVQRPPLAAIAATGKRIVARRDELRRVTARSDRGHGGRGDNPLATKHPILQHHLAEACRIAQAQAQAARGQNLNFAISIDSLDTLPENAAEQSVAEWTIHRSRRTPALAASLCNRGARLSIQGEYEAALDYFKRAAETNPDDPEAWFGLGSCYVGLDRPDDAIRAYRRPIEKDPDNALAHFILAMYYKAVGQFDDEVAALSEVIRIDPANIQARFELGRAYGELARPEDQIHTLEKILDERPDHIPALIGLGAALAENGRPDEALQLLNRAHDLEPGNPMIHYNMGVMYNHLDRPADAAAAYIRAIRLSPRMAPAHYNLGLTYLAQGKPKRALDQYEILKALDEKAAGSLFDNIYPPDSAPHPETDARQ